MQTTVTTATDHVRITDALITDALVTGALVTGVAGRLLSAELARRVDGLKGAVALRWSVAPATLLGVRGIDHGPSAAEG